MKPLRALLVEDSVDDTDLMILELTRAGFEVSFKRVETAKTMRNVLQEHSWDVILSDYRMPEFDGLEALKVLKESGIDLPFIIVSGTIGEELAVEAMKAGAHDYIMKDNLTRLAPAIVRELKEADSRRMRKKAEQALRESEEKFRSIFEESPVAINVYDSNRLLIDANEACLRMFGVDSKDAFLGLDLFNDPNLPDEIKQNLLKGQPIRYESHFDFSKVIEQDLYKTSKSGIMYIDAVLSPITRGTDHSVQMYLAQMQDITERKESEKALQLNESRLKALVNLSQMTDATMDQLCDFALEQAVQLTRSRLGYLAFMNEDETVLTMHSWSKSAMEECALPKSRKMYPIDSIGLWGEAVRQRKPIITNDYSAPSPWKKGYPKGHVAIVRHMNIPVFDGERIVAVAGVGNKDDDYNESDVHQLTLLIQGMWMLLQQRRSVETIRNAAGTATLYLDLMGHDIRNHLQAIIMGTEILKHYESGADIEPVYSLITDSIQNSTDLIRKVNTTRGLLSVQLVNISLREVVENSLGVLKDKFDGLEIKADYQVQSAVIKADEFLWYLLMNLLENAVLHNNKKVRKLWIVLSEVEGGYRISIKDNGPGINDEKKKSLFDSGRRFGGVGIHQAMRIVRKYGGKISVHDRVSGDTSQGAEFCVWFPRLVS
jgi:two-component system phosphate regulon sensor histidine kinase PhoR